MGHFLFKKMHVGDSTSSRDKGLVLVLVTRIGMPLFIWTLITNTES